MSNSDNSDNTEKKPATHKFQPLPTGKVFDVVRPGRAPASPSSRPVIVSQPSVADAQFVGKKQAEPQEESVPVVSVKVEAQAELRTEPAAPTAEALKIPAVVMLSQVDARMDEQLDESTAAEEPVAQEKEEHPVEQAAPEKAAAPDKGKTIQVASEEPEQPTEEPSHTESKDASAKEQGGEKLLSPLTEEDIATHLGHDELVANTNFTTADMIVSHHRHRLTVWQFLLIFGLIVVLAVVAFNFLLDAGVVTTELSVPHTNILR